MRLIDPRVFGQICARVAVAMINGVRKQADLEHTIKQEHPGMYPSDVTDIVEAARLGWARLEGKDGDDLESKRR